MADLEVIKHSKRIYKVVNRKKHSFGLRLREVVIDVLIIVFAVSLSIWLHSWSERTHQQKEVKEFLLDLKGDLRLDLLSMEEQKASITASISDFAFLQTLTVPKIDSIERSGSVISLRMSPTIRESNSGNYEGFKSSGDIGLIRHKKLKSKILRYYQQDISRLTEVEKLYNSQLLNLQNLTVTKWGKRAMFLDPAVKATFTYLIQSGNNNLLLYTKTIAEVQEMIREIDRQYPAAGA